SGISDTRIEQIREAALKEGQISTAISKIITQRTQAIANASKRMLPYFEEVAAARFKSIGRYLRGNRRIRKKSYAKLTVFS
ncbi:TPA: hypothetical protein ACUK0A_005344, partial [Escherichia coli]